ncbi:transposase family protein [Rhodoblastus sphagnicola]|uniref:transposase family protein n=1 Tax=Rhodoblastus sphagnicola TaxID=333368 RepID=UPI001304FBF7
MKERKFLAGNQTDLLHLSNLYASSTYKEDGSLIVEASTLTPRVHRCGLFCELVKSGTKTIRFRDFPIQSQPTWLEISRQRFRCKEHGRRSMKTCRTSTRPLA